MNINLRNLLNGTPVRLRYVFRYSTSRVQHPESVAEHSYYVALYSMFIADWISDIGRDPGWPLATTSAVDIPTLLRRALLHDLEESRSGDFPRPFKHSDPHLKAVLEEASALAFQQVTEEITERKEYTDFLGKMWRNSKDSSNEGRILEFADFLSVLSFMMQEASSGGNASIKSHVKDMDKYFDKFVQEEFDFIRPLVVQAGSLMDELFDHEHRTSETN